MPRSDRHLESGSSEPEDPVPSSTDPLPAFAVAALLPFEVPFEAAGPPLDTPMTLLYLAITLGGALLAALGSIAVASLLGYSRTLLAAELAEEHGDEESGVREQLHAEISKRESEYLAVSFAYTVAGWIIGLWALRLAVVEEHQEYYVTALVTFGAVMLLVAGSLPVAITKFRAERALLAVRPAVHAGWLVLRWPLVVPLLLLTRLCMIVLRIRSTPPNDRAEVQKQVMAAVADSTEEALEGEERTWIGNILALKDLQVGKIMTQRPDIVAFEQNRPLHEFLEAALEQGFSRYPVYRERIDEIVGICYVKDALKLLQGRQKLGDMTVQSMMRDTLFVPETMGAAQLLRLFQAGNQHMAIVLDEYGTTAGIVSVEDVLEQIVGDLADEYDEEPGSEEAEEDEVTVIEAGHIVEVSGRSPVSAVNQVLGSQLPEVGDWETIAGLVIAHCNRIPRAGEKIVIAGIEFTVLAADERRLARMRMTLLESHVAQSQAVHSPPGAG